MAITIKTSVENPRPTTTGVRDGVDFDATVYLAEEGVEWRFTITLTCVPAADDPRYLVPYGTSVDQWMSKSPRNWPAWAQAHEKVIVESLAGGEGVEEIEVEL